MSKTNARPREKRSGVVLFTVGGGGDVYGRANRQSSSGVPDVAGCQSFTVGRTFAICWLPVINRWPDVAVCRLAVRSQSTGRFPSAGLAVAHKQPDVAVCRLAVRSQSTGRFPSAGLAVAHKQPLTSNRTLPSAALPFAHNQPAVFHLRVWLLLTSNRTLPSVGLPVCPSRVP